MFWLQMNTVHCETCQYEARLSIDNIIIISIFLGDCHRVSIGWQIQLQEGKFAQRLLSAAVLQCCRHGRIQTLGLVQTVSYLNLQDSMGIEYL